MDRFTSSFNVGDDEAGFNLKLTSTDERDDDTFRALDCNGSVIGIGVDVVIVVVFVVVDNVETTADSVGIWIWSILVKSFFPRLAYGSRSDAARNCCWIIETGCWGFCSCFGACDMNVEEDDVTAGWVCVAGKPVKSEGLKGEAFVVAGALIFKILVADDAKENGAVVGTVGCITKLLAIGGAPTVVVNGTLKIFAVPDVDVIEFGTANLVVVVAVVRAVLLKGVVAVDCGNILLVATGWGANPNGVDVFLFVVKP